MINKVKNAMQKLGIPVENLPDGELFSELYGYRGYRYLDRLYVNFNDGGAEFMLQNYEAAYQAAEALEVAATRDIAQKSITEAVSETISPYNFNNLTLEWGSDYLNIMVKFTITDCSESEFAENAVDEIVELMAILDANGDAIIQKAWQRCAINNHDQIQANLTATKVAAQVAVANFKGIFQNLSGTEIDLFAEIY